jgi:tetratricopeptide (TPR) repeat protein
VTMEYAVLKDNELRMRFYLAKGYFDRGQYEKAIKFYLLYMKEAWWRPEIAEAWLDLAKCCWQTQKGDDARKYCLNAIAVNPDYKEALNCMSEYTGDGQKKYWKRYAEIATNNEVLFKLIT